MKTGRLLRAPLLHFLLLGGGIFALQTIFSQPGSPSPSADRVVCFRGTSIPCRVAAGRSRY